MAPVDKSSRPSAASKGKYDEYINSFSKQHPPHNISIAAA